MADCLAGVISTVQGLSTDFLTAEIFISAFSELVLLATVAGNFLDFFAARTRASMANLLTVMFSAIL